MKNILNAEETANKLLEYRILSKQTQTQVAEKVGMKKQQYCLIENARGKKITVATYIKLSPIFNELEELKKAQNGQDGDEAVE